MGPERRGKRIYAVFVAGKNNLPAPLYLRPQAWPPTSYLRASESRCSVSHRGPPYTAALPGRSVPSQPPPTPHKMPPLSPGRSCRLHLYCQHRRHHHRLGLHLPALADAHASGGKNPVARPTARVSWSSRRAGGVVRRRVGAHPRPDDGGVPEGLLRGRPRSRLHRSSSWRHRPLPRGWRC